MADLAVLAEPSPLLLVRVRPHGRRATCMGLNTVPSNKTGADIDI
jgi:hypothetical protein